VFRRGTRVLENSIEDNPYGFLKRIEETMLFDACKALGANLAIGRLWAAGGLQMPVNNAYALSDFISSALIKAQILVKSPHRVYRSYCDASDFMAVLVSEANEETFSRFDSGGVSIELSDLAQLVARRTGARIMDRVMFENSEDDLYLPEAEKFLELTEKYSIAPTSIEDIVKKTIMGHEYFVR
jgi:nucleoside-diphosphate-sugar epimerase